MGFFLTVLVRGVHCGQVLEKQGARSTRMGENIQGTQGKTPGQIVILDVFGIDCTPLAVGLLAVGLHLPRLQLVESSSGLIW